MDRVVVLAYGSPDQVARISRKATEQVPQPDRLTIGLSLLEPETSDEAEISCDVHSCCRGCIRQVTLYNHGLADARRVTWVAAALEA